MVKQVQLALEITEWVRSGETVVVKAKAKGARWFGTKRYFFSSDSGAIHTIGNNGYIDTYGFAPGTYIVKGHFEQGLSQADAAATFTVVE